VSKYKELGSVTASSRKTVIGLKISEYHLMMKSLNSILLKRLRVSWVDCAVCMNIKEHMHVTLICRSTVVLTVATSHLIMWLFLSLSLTWTRFPHLSYNLKVHSTF
jgi:hypothetical protein